MPICKKKIILCLGFEGRLLWLETYMRQIFPQLLDGLSEFCEEEIGLKKIFILSVIGIIIIGGVSLAINSGKLILPVEKKESFVAESYENYPTRLCVSGNKLIDENKKEIVLKGLMAPDPQKIFREGNFSKDYYDGIFSFGGI